MPTILSVEVEAWKSRGYPFLKAYKHAHRYCARFTYREETEPVPSPDPDSDDELADVLDVPGNWTPDVYLLCESSIWDAFFSPEDRLRFNQVFEELYDFALTYACERSDDIGVHYLTYLVHNLNLAHMLRDDLQERIGSDVPSSRYELAVNLGYTLREGSRVPQGFDSRMKQFTKVFRNFARHLE